MSFGGTGLLVCIFAVKTAGLHSLGFSRRLSYVINLVINSEKLYVVTFGDDDWNLNT